MQNQREIEDYLLFTTAAEYSNLEAHEASSLEPGKFGFPAAAHRFLSFGVDRFLNSLNLKQRPIFTVVAN